MTWNNQSEINEQILKMRDDISKGPNGAPQWLKNRYNEHFDKTRNGINKAHQMANNSVTWSQSCLPGTPAHTSILRLPDGNEIDVRKWPNETINDVQIMLTGYFRKRPLV